MCDRHTFACGEGGREESRVCVRLQNFPQRQKDEGSDAGKSS